MSELISLIDELKALGENKINLVAISKTQSPERVMELYNEGQLDFGENKVQDLIQKQIQLPKDIKWHFVGHLQRNKVKYIAPFVHLIHAVDSLKLAREIDKQAQKLGKLISILIQAHIADEDSKFGIDVDDLPAFFDDLESQEFQNIDVLGLMGMATNSRDVEKVKGEFDGLAGHFETLRGKSWKSNIKMEYLSMGMSSDYNIAIDSGSNMIRVGTKLFGARKI